jgi:predicted phage tail protein
MGTQAPLKLRGRKSGLFGLGGNGSAPDNLFTDDIVEIVMGVSEGPVQGLYNGPASVYLNDTPLVNNNGAPTLGDDIGTDNFGETNFGQFNIALHKGFNPPDAIQSQLGGFGSATEVGVLLDSGLPVIRTGSQLNINFISFRILFSALYDVDGQGNQSNATASFKLEYKPNSSTTWAPTFTSVATNQTTNVSTTTIESYNANGLGGTATANNYRESFIQPTQPTAAQIDAVWFNSGSGSGYTPTVLDSSGHWDVPAGLTYTSAGIGVAYPYWQWTDDTGLVHAFVGTPGANPPTGLSPTDFWIAVNDPLNGGVTQAYVYNTSGWVTNIDWTIDPIATAGVIQINGKTTSNYVAEYRVPVPPLSDDYYDVRVTKLSGENTDNYFATMTWDSFIELNNSPLSFPNLSILYALIRATDQFSQVPTVTLDLLGRIIKVPSNYNATTKVYTGVWDGTWQLAYSNNTAYVAQDLISNDVYGINAYYPAVVDPDSVYAFGQHCDTYGFTYNEFIADARPLVDAVNYILATAGGLYVDYGDGFGTILFDSDSDPAVALFSTENVTDGIFTYSRTDITSRKNDFIVSYVDPTQNWIENRREVSNATLIATYGLNREEFIAAGCIDETEAYKRARMRLEISTLECTIVEFKCNRVGLYLQPYNVIIVADANAATGISGRISAVRGTNMVELRDLITLEAGFVYQVSFQIPDPTTSTSYALWQSTITTAPGQTMSLTTADALPALPPRAVFSLGCSSDQGFPKAFRISEINEVEGSPDTVSISATEVNREKWAYINGAVTLPTTSSSGPTTNSVAPVTGLGVFAQVNTPGQIDLVIEWTPSASTFIQCVNITCSKNGAQALPLVSVGGSGATSYLYQNVGLGTYLFALSVVNVNGFTSVSAQTQFVVGGNVRSVSPPSALSIVGEPVLGVFNSQNPVFQWVPNTNSYSDGYVVSITNTSTGALLHSEILGKAATSWTYTYAQNTADGGTPNRSFTFSIYAIDSSGNASESISLACSNPPPAAATGLSVSTGGVITFNPGVAPDWLGTQVYTSITGAFSTPSGGTLIYDGPLLTASTTIPGGDTLYVLIGQYDNFGPETIGTWVAGMS